MPGRIDLTAGDLPSAALDWLLREFEGAGVPPDLRDRALLAVGEWVSNVHEHGTQPDGGYSIEWAGGRARVIVTVCEDGAGIAEETVESASLPDDPYAVGGRGLFLIRTLSDRFESTEGTVVLTFTPRSP